MSPFFSSDKNFSPENSERMLRDIRTKKEAHWVVEGERRTLRLFQRAAKEVPAYKDFLKKAKVQPGKIKTIKDFALVPPVGKKNYLRQYSLEELCWQGHLKTPIVYTSTSGSTGQSFYFPRHDMTDWQSSIFHEMFLRNDPACFKKSTLVIVGFGMGVWIGGLITYQAFRLISLRNSPFSILTPGSNKKEILEAMKSIGKKYDQVILCGYPPFIKDVIDAGKEFGVRWSQFNLKIIFAAEAFSETFRNYVARKAGIKNIYTDIMNIYGSADLGTMAEETPFSVLTRRLALDDPKIYQALFPYASRLPTVAQFNPLFTYFEAPQNQILCTGDSALPLIRYDIGDHGGVISFGEVVKTFKEDDISIMNEARSLGFGKSIAELPFVYVYERSDLSTKLYGAIMYPEHIREALHDPSILDSVTGKFTMITKNDVLQNEYLEINVELKPNAKLTGELKREVRTAIMKFLVEKNAEYRYLAQLMPARVDPKILYWKHEHHLHFKPGIKQKWVKKELAQAR